MDLPPAERAAGCTVREDPEGAERCAACEGEEGRRAAVARVGWRLLDGLLDGPQRRARPNLGPGGRPADSTVATAVDTLLRTGRAEERDGKLHLTAAGQQEAERHRRTTQAAKRAAGLGLRARLDRVEQILRSLPPEDPEAGVRDVSDDVVAELEALVEPVAVQLRSVALRAGRRLHHAPICGSFGDPDRSLSRGAEDAGWWGSIRDVSARLEAAAVVQLLTCPRFCDRCVGEALAEIAFVRDQVEEHGLELPALPVAAVAEEPEQTADDEAMTYDQAAGFLAMGRRTLEQLVAQELIPFYKIGAEKKSRVRFSRKALEAWQADGGARSARSRRRS